MREGAQFLNAGLSPSEALTVAEVTPDTLATWYKRGLLPKEEFPETAPGHGKRRRYTVRQVITLAVARVLIDAGCPVEASMYFASFESGTSSSLPSAGWFSTLPYSIFSRVYQGLDQPLEEVAKGLNESEVPLALVWRVPEGWTFPFAIKAHGFALAANVEFDGIRTILRNRVRPISAAVILDKVLIAARILSRLQAIRDARTEKRTVG